jgi:hypothetical protein
LPTLEQQLLAQQLLAQQLLAQQLAQQLARLPVLTLALSELKYRVRELPQARTSVHSEASLQAGKLLQPQAPQTSRMTLRRKSVRVLT